MDTTRILSILLVGGLFGLGACSSSSAGDDSSSEDELHAAACGGKACGDACTLCNGRPGCVETAVVKACNGEGRCTPEAPRCPSPDGGAPPTEPCSGKSCGETCSTCTGPTCPAVVEWCDADGRCSMDRPVCEAADGGATEDPCADKRCGERCSTCPPGVPCPTVLEWCDAKGQCSRQNPTCGSLDAQAPPKDPCAGRSCGDTCSTCPPNAFCPAVVEFCDARGRCAATQPVCSRNPS